MNKRLNKETILFDGAMGTYISQKYNINITQSEYENIRHPEHVLKIHKEYIEAGADAIKTNTFFANTVAYGIPFVEITKIIDAGCQIAKQAAQGSDVLVFADIGPIASDEKTVITEYQNIITRFLHNGINYFLLETFDDYEILITLAQYIKKLASDAYVIAECTVAPDKYSKSGVSANRIIENLYPVPEIDAYGFNCTCGPLHLLNIISEIDFKDKPVSIMPNAGYPSIASGRTVFETAPDYFAEQLLKIKNNGVKFIGGCCGTTPIYIKKVRQLLLSGKYEKVERKIPIPSKSQKAFDIVAAKKAENHKLIAVELDPPMNADVDFFLESANKLYKAGADLITIADCPIARARVDSSLMAAKLKREFSIEAMPHLTCRDRNINATKALLLGLNTEGVHNVLVVTGDSVPSGQRTEVKSVFNFNSIKLAAFISDLNSNIFSQHPFNIMAALNINAANFPKELERAQKKEQAGVTSFLTQPIYDDKAAQNLLLAKKSLKAHLLSGIMPIVSYKNACFINNEIAGISIPEEILLRYKDTEPQEAAQLAVEISIEIIEKIQDITDGYYLIVPLQRVDIICQLIDRIKGRF
ncbi:MAG: bifunctional homocysteine S-methyltransferase/methylenetetrahydrofolate reductase [Bacillota bacterium]|jgi:methionine synthase I (cobalamin-dependent)/5,10-methylenetetrahydrofolate reductase